MFWNPSQDGSLPEDTEIKHEVDCCGWGNAVFQVEKHEKSEIFPEMDESPEALGPATDDEGSNEVTVDNFGLAETDQFHGPNEAQFGVSESVFSNKNICDGNAKLGRGYCLTGFVDRRALDCVKNRSNLCEVSDLMHN